MRLSAPTSSSAPTLTSIGGLARLGDARPGAGAAAARGRALAVGAVGVGEATGPGAGPSHALAQPPAGSAPRSRSSPCGEEPGAEEPGGEEASAITRSMASTIPAYPVQRHRFPLISARISLRLRLLLRRTRSRAAISMPGV